MQASDYTSVVATVAITPAIADPTRVMDIEDEVTIPTPPMAEATMVGMAMDMAVTTGVATIIQATTAGTVMGMADIPVTAMAVMAITGDMAMAVTIMATAVTTQTMDIIRPSTQSRKRDTSHRYAAWTAVADFSRSIPSVVVVFTTHVPSRRVERMI